MLAKSHSYAFLALSNPLDISMTRLITSIAIFKSSEIFDRYNFILQNKHQLLSHTTYFTAKTFLCLPGRNFFGCPRFSLLSEGYERLAAPDAISKNPSSPPGSINGDGRVK